MRFVETKLSRLKEGNQTAYLPRLIDLIDKTQVTHFLAHLSRRLIGELIVYEGIRCPSVVLLSTFSNDISSEAVSLILFIFHI